ITAYIGWHSIGSYSFMKKSGVSAMFAIAGLSVAMVTSWQSAITGRVTPATEVEAIWVISENDSIRATLASGNFSVNVKPGVYKIIVDAKDPYKDALMENLDVKSNAPFDVGEIILQQ
ncbi:MAG TPA: hypothetical protein VEB42_13755, partial [Chitinophagaceae bacterium]|nr:hypothetical protein [Chitinophagaceae bacterium]